MLSLTHATHMSTMSKIVTPVTTLNILPVTVTTPWIHVASNLCLVSSFHLHVITWEQLATVLSRCFLSSRYVRFSLVCPRPLSLLRTSPPLLLVPTNPVLRSSSSPILLESSWMGLKDEEWKKEVPRVLHHQWLVCVCSTQSYQCMQ